jgi:hypothetical protein
MPTKRPSEVSFDTVRKIGLSLPGVEDSSKRGNVALKGLGTLMVWAPEKKSLDPGTVAFRVDDEARDELIAADPDTYYVTDHYLNYNTVLVRLARVDEDALRDLVGMAHKFVARKASRSPVRKRR